MLLRYLSLLYLLDSFPDVDECTEYLRKRCAETHGYISKIIEKGVEEMGKKLADNINVSILDFWGYLLQELLEPSLKKFLLSDSRSAVATCQLPFPLFTAASVNKDDATGADSGEFLFLMGPPRMVFTISCTRLVLAERHRCSHLFIPCMYRPVPSQ